MNEQNEILQQRWSMITNPFALAVPPLCRATEMEIIEHSLLLERLPTDDGRQLSGEDMRRCRVRFMRFCRTQYENRGRN